MNTMSSAPYTCQINCHQSPDDINTSSPVPYAPPLPPPPPSAPRDQARAAAAGGPNPSAHAQHARAPAATTTTSARARARAAAAGGAGGLVRAAGRQRGRALLALPQGAPQLARTHSVFNCKTHPPSQPPHPPPPPPPRPAFSTLLYWRVFKVTHSPTHTLCSF